jgi:hypothetical protein
MDSFLLRLRCSFGYCHNYFSITVARPPNLSLQVDPQAPEAKSQDLFQQLESLMVAQDDIISQVSFTPSTPSTPSLRHSLTPSTPSHPHSLTPSLPHR